MELSLLLNAPLLLTADSKSGSDREDEIIDLLRNIGSLQAPRLERIEAVRHCLHGTSSDMVRNQAALALVDLISHEAAPDIIQVLRNKDLGSRSGTLLFALNEVEAELPLDILARTVVGGSYEAQNEVMFALEQSRVALADDETEERVIADVAPLLKSGDEAVVEVAGSLISLIERRRSVHANH